MIFKNVAGEEYSLHETIKEIERYINNEQDQVYNMIIGTDSLYSKKETTFVTAIIIHRVGRGGRFFYTKRKINHDIDICSRLLQETHDSISIMREVEKSDIMYMLDDYAIHIDAGKNGNSNKIIKECVAYVTGFGYHCEVKPQAYGASCVADKFTK